MSRFSALYRSACADLALADLESRGLTAVLDATPAGREVYRQEGFRDTWGFKRYAMSNRPEARSAMRPLREEDWRWVLALDAQAFGASREMLLRSLAQCLRAEMRPAGVRVINVFPGPIDDEWNQLLPPPKLAPETLSRAIVGALRDGIEDVYPGDVAQEWLARWRDNPKALERELSA